MESDGPTLPRPAASTRQVMTGVATMFGWFVVATAVTAALVFMLYEPKPQNCIDQCYPDWVAALFILAIFGIPTAFIGLIAGGVVLALVTRRPRSGLTAGTIAGLIGLVIGLAITIGSY